MKKKTLTESLQTHAFNFPPNIFSPQTHAATTGVRDVILWWYNLTFSMMDVSQNVEKWMDSVNK